MPPTPQAPVPSLPYAHFIQHRLPEWLGIASTRQRANLREALIACHHSAAWASEILAPLKSLDAFAEPILELDLEADFPELRDMQQATLDKFWQRGTFLWQPLYDASHEHSLLEAALYNFESWETRGDAFGSGSSLYATGKAKGLKSNLTPAAFAQRCRRLDLGLKYRQHLRQTLDVTDPANEPLAPSDKHQLFIGHQRNRFDVTLQMAYLRGELSPEGVKQLKLFLSPPEQTLGQLLLCHRVRLLGHVLPGIVHFAADPDDPKGRCAVYFPGHPSYLFKEYTSLLAFQVTFMAYLNAASFRQWVCQLMPIDCQEPLLLKKLADALRTTPVHADLVSLSRPIEGELFEDIHRQQRQHLMNDLDRLAPPAARVKAAEREKLLDEFHVERMDLLSSLRERIPQFKRTLSEPLDLVLAHEIYQDLHTWGPVQRLAGSIHLLNLVEARASGQVTAQMQTEGELLPELVAIRTLAGTRLWNADPRHYRVALRRPERQWPSDALGLHTWAGKRYVLLDESYYEVRYEEQTGHWHVLSQSRPPLYSPPLRHNGVGAWRTLDEDATHWPVAKLVARLSPRAAQLPATLATALLPLGGSNPHMLRRLHQHSRRTPPLLRDSLKRLWILKEIEGFDLDEPKDSACAELCPAIHSHLARLLPDVPAQAPLRLRKKKSRKFIQYPKGSQLLDIDQAHWLPELFDRLYQQLEQPATAEEQRLHTEHPELPLSFLEDLAFTLQTVGQDQTTLPDLHREIERALEQVRISRVFEGLFPEGPYDRHSERLAFALLETLEDWPQDIRLELMDTQSDPCQPLQGIGVDNSLNYRRLVKKDARYEVQDRQGKTLITEADFYSALWQALPLQTQGEIGQHHEIGPEPEQIAFRVKRALFRQAARLRSQVPAVRNLQRLLAPPMTAAASDLPVPFAVPGRLVSGLQLRDDGIYWNLNRRPLANHAHRHYIIERHRYYPVKWSPDGWRLLNASNPYGFYQPLLQRKSDNDPRWTLHQPAQKRKLLVQADSLLVPTDNGSHDEKLRQKMFTQAQRLRLQAPKSYHTCLNSPLAYDRVDNARYPLRDLDGQPMLITAVHYSSAPGAPQSRTRAQQLLPYLAQGVEVARLYESKLRIKRFQARHLQSADEQHLVGRFRVTARNDLADGELLGVYGGMLIPLLVCHHRLDPFATWVQEDRSLELLRVRDGQVQAALPCLTGDNILSRINTIFEYEDGVPVRQARDGYNVEAVAFPIDVQAHGCSGTDGYFITALFTRQAVRAEEELRLNHGYSDEQIQALNSAQPSGPDSPE